MPRPLILVIALDAIGVIGVVVAGFGHQQGDPTLTTTGIAAAALSAAAGAFTLLTWSRHRPQVGEGQDGDPVVREL